MAGNITIGRKVKDPFFLGQEEVLPFLEAVNLRKHDDNPPSMAPSGLLLLALITAFSSSFLFLLPRPSLGDPLPPSQGPARFSTLTGTREMTVTVSDLHHLTAVTTTIAHDGKISLAAQGGIARLRINGSHFPAPLHFEISPWAERLEVQPFFLLLFLLGFSSKKPFF